jgi:nucleotide-binding universal stress UspA family protein
MLDFLVSTRNVHSWPDSTRYAAELAALMKASLTGLYVYDPVTALPHGAPPTLLEDAVNFLRELLHTALRAGPDFEQWVRSRGVDHVQWRVGQGSYPHLMASLAPWHDLLIVESQPESAFESPGGIGELLLDLRQPCLIVPAQPAPARLETILVASNGSPESIRAIRSSMPLLKRASSVTLLQSSHPFRTPRLGLESLDVHLGRHGIAVQTQVLEVAEHDAGLALLHAAEKAGADLLVMGAYGRSRLSEWFLGGATRQVLQKATIPVLMQH